MCAAAEDNLGHLALRYHLVPLPQQVLIAVIIAAADGPAAHEVMADKKKQQQAVVKQTIVGAALVGLGLMTFDCLLPLHPAISIA